MEHATKPGRDGHEAPSSGYHGPAYGGHCGVPGVLVTLSARPKPSGSQHPRPWGTDIGARLRAVPRRGTASTLITPASHATGLLSVSQRSASDELTDLKAW